MSPPIASNVDLDTRDFFIYFQCSERALKDEKITAEESRLLSTLETKLNPSGESWFDIAAAIHAGEKEQPFVGGVDHERDLKEPQKDHELYEQTLITALKDDEINVDEWAILYELRGLLDISLITHSEIEHRLLEQHREEAIHPQFEDRLKQYLDLHLTFGAK